MSDLATSERVVDQPAEREASAGEADDELEGQEAEEQVEEPTGDEPAEEETSEETAEAALEDDDSEEFEWDGKTIRGPKGLKDGVMFHADYTRKTQEVAERRRELEAAEERLNQRFQADQEEMDLRAKHFAQQEQIKQYQQVDWNAYADQDPIEAQKAWYHFQNLQNQVGETNNLIEERARQRSAEAAQDLRTRLHQTREWAKTQIKGYSADTENKVLEFARERGFSDRDLAAAMSPQVFEVLHLAAIGASVQNSPAAKPKPAQATPLKTVGAKSSPPASTDLEKMDMDQYVAHRTKQEAARS